MGVFSNWAQKYYEHGLNVMPVIGKNQPVESGFDKWKNKLMSQEELDHFIEKYPDANIALLTGEGSKRIGFDFDYTGPRAKELEAVVLELLPPTNAVKIGKKGFTRFYKWNGHKTINFLNPNPETVKDKNGKDVKKREVIFEIQSSGRYTIIPPSIHPDIGTPYIWANGEPDWDELPELPGYIIGSIIDICEKFFGKEKQSGRNQMLWAYALKCAHEHKSYATWKAAIIDYDNRKFGSESWFADPAERRHLSREDFTEKMCQSWLKSVKKNKKQYEGIDFDFGVEVEKKELFYKEEYFDAIQAEYPTFNDGFRIIEIKPNQPDKLIPAYRQFSHYMMDVEGLRIYNKNYFYWHNGVRYQLVNDMLFKRIISTRVFYEASINYINNYFKRCEVDAQRAGKTPNTPAGLINLKNGVFDIATGELMPHSKKYFFTNVVDVTYNKDAKCDQWLATLDSIFEGKAEIIEAVQKMFGYVLMGGYPFLHKAFLLIGSGRNGKGIVLNMLKKILGSGSYSVVPLSLLDKPFSAVMLDGSLANISEETPSMINAEIFKNIVGGGEVQAAFKGKDEYRFKAKCRMVFACNDFPYFDDKNNSMNARLFIIPFNRTYTEGVDLDPHLFDKLVVEAPGVLNWAFEGAKALIENPIIKQPEQSVEMKEEYRQETDPVYAWFTDCVKLAYPKPTFGILTTEIYQRYKAWSVFNGHLPVSIAKFSKRLSRLVKEKFGVYDCPKNTLYEPGKYGKCYDVLSVKQLD